MKKAEARERARVILDQVGLEGLGERLPAELSGGQQQRVAVARAIVQQPRRDPVPTSRSPMSMRNCDATAVRQDIRALQRSFGLTAVYVTPRSGRGACRLRSYRVMDRGRIAQIGTPEDLYDRPANAFIADFIGDANLLAGIVTGGRFTGAGIDLPIDGPDGPATVSIRPERIGLFPGGPAKVLTATYLGSRMEYLTQTRRGRASWFQGPSSSLAWRLEHRQAS